MKYIKIEAEYEVADEVADLLQKVSMERDELKADNYLLDATCKSQADVINEDENTNRMLLDENKALLDNVTTLSVSNAFTKDKLARITATLQGLPGEPVHNWVPVVHDLLKTL